MSIKFTIPNSVTKVDWTATSVSDGGATIPVINKPSLSAVATSGAYADLAGKPALATVAGSGAYTDLTGTPALATVATSGKFDDLTGNITVASTGTVKVATPQFWKWNLTTGANISTFGTVQFIGNANWTPYFPTGSSNLMTPTAAANASFITIPATGIYTITNTVVWSSASAGSSSWIQTSDTGVATICYGAVCSTTTSWTGRLPAGALLKPSYQAASAVTITASTTPITAITVAQLYLCN